MGWLVMDIKEKSFCSNNLGLMMLCLGKWFCPIIGVLSYQIVSKFMSWVDELSLWQFCSFDGRVFLILKQLYRMLMNLILMLVRLKKLLLGLRLVRQRLMCVFSPLQRRLSLPHRLLMYPGIFIASFSWRFQEPYVFVLMVLDWALIQQRTWVPLLQ